MTQLLFVCSENALRSPMAEALAKSILNERYIVDSAGVRAGDLNYMAVAVMMEIGIDISNHRAKRLQDMQNQSLDIIITLSPEAQHNAIELTRDAVRDVEYWPTPDPSVAEGNREMILDAYRQLRHHLERQIRDRFMADSLAGS